MPPRTCLVDAGGIAGQVLWIAVNQIKTQCWANQTLRYKNTVKNPGASPEAFERMIHPIDKKPKQASGY